MSEYSCIDCDIPTKGFGPRCRACAAKVLAKERVGKKLSEEHKQKLKSAWNYDRHITDSWKKKQSEVHKGKPVVPSGSKWSEKRRKQQLEAFNRWTPEFKAERSRKISESHLKEKNYNWVSDRSKLKQRPTPEQNEWKKKVMERDNYTCQQCGLKSKNLDCHHIKNYKRYPELRWEVSNGLALCHECHMKTEDYGVNLRFKKKHIDEITK